MQTSAQDKYESAIEAGAFINGLTFSLESEARNEIFQMMVMLNSLPENIVILTKDADQFVKLTKPEFNLFFQEYSTQYLAHKTTLLNETISQLQAQ